MYVYDTAAIDAIIADIREKHALIADWLESCRVYGTLEELHARLADGFAQIDAAGVAAIKRGIADADAGRFVTDEEMEAELDRIDAEISDAR